ncbi:probable ATP-dependent RNA helicase DDX52 isoform X2 [Ptychodera flava]|uniref:probable ATP-dependent RNA helicase DDX52 isoform X2 n=1 Tax=Ptychodera flava TaxID=63121 RepID=UPI00396A11A1
MASPAAVMFAKLGVGVTFDAKRFKRDAKRFQMSTSPGLHFKQSIHQDQHNDLDSHTRHECTVTRGKRKRGNEDYHISQQIHEDESVDLFHSVDKINQQRKDNTVTIETKSLKKPDLKKCERIDGELQENIRREKVTAFRRKRKIHVYGTDVPDPVVSFQQFKKQYNVNPILMRNIESVGFESPTPIQMQAIPLMVHRRELLACAPTGSGKTAAFILPVLHHLKEPQRNGIRAVVVSPTRELAKQTYREFCRLSDGTGIKVRMVHNMSKAIENISQKTLNIYDILVTTPNRLVYMLNHEPPILYLSSVQWLVIDECDKLFEEGKQGFREQLATIYQACDSSEVRRAMFSATYSYDLEQWCKLTLDNVASVTVGQRNSAVQTVQQELLFVGEEYGKLIAVRDIMKKGVQPPVLVFVQSKERAKELFHELLYDSINVDVIHADRTQQQRDDVVQSFRAGKIWVLICTELMGRGIDFKGVNLVINYDFPSSAVSYIHRIGRTGRAGRPGKAVTLFTHDDLSHLRSIAGVMKEAGCPVPNYMLRLRKPNKKMKREMELKQVQRETVRTLPRAILHEGKNKRKKKTVTDTKSSKNKQRRKKIHKSKPNP